MSDEAPQMEENVVQEEELHPSPPGAPPEGGTGQQAGIPPENPLRVLCVDDEENILKALTRLFRTEPFQVLTATSGREALDILRRTAGIGLILSDQRMPEMTGTEFLEQAALLVPDTPRMILTGYADMNAAIAAINQGGAQRFLVKPWNEQELLLAVKDGLQRYQLIQENQRLRKELEEWNSNLKQRVLQQTAQLRKKLAESNQQNLQTQKNGEALILMFADLLDQRHHRLSRHTRTVTALVESMMRTLNLPQHRRDIIRNAALLHDIGLLCVSDRVLTKSVDTMTGDELTEYRAHAIKGQTALKVSEDLDEIGLIIRHHHEQFDGNGFPDGLIGEQIPQGSRLIHLASFIDHAYTPEAGIDAKFQLTRKLTPAMGVLFDPALAAAANQAIREVLDDPQAKRAIVEQEVRIKDLKEGMVLTRDIYSSRGLLILERGTVIGGQSLADLQRHQLSIPLSKLAYVQKGSGGGR